MPFEKGNDLGKGREKGSVNKDRKAFLIALNELFEKNADQMIDWLAEIEEPEKRFEILNKFANYLHPKLSSTTNETTIIDAGKWLDKVQEPDE